MAKKTLTEEETKHVRYELGCAALTAEMHSTAFHWISQLIGQFKHDKVGNDTLLEIAHHLADDWNQRASEDCERFDRAAGALEAKS